MAAKIRKVVLKKTELATYRGLGMTNAELGTKYSVKPSEINDALIAFGMKKGTPKEYQIELVNDFDISEFDGDENEEKTDK